MGGRNIQDLVDGYAVFRLEADLSHLSENDRDVVRLLIEASRPMDDVFWMQAYGDREEALALARGDEAARRYIEINYGPWDRLRADDPFIAGVGATLREAAELASDRGLATYLRLRADALASDDYQPSDMAWLDMKENPIEVVIGPIETYEDLLFGAKAAHEGFVLIKDLEWSERLERFAALLPSLQESLPVADRYKAETPGTDSDLNAYDAVYYAGERDVGQPQLPHIEPVHFDQLDSIEFVLVPYQHSADSAFIEHAPHYRISQQLPGPRESAAGVVVFDGPEPLAVPPCHHKPAKGEEPLRAEGKEILHCREIERLWAEWSVNANGFLERPQQVIVDASLDDPSWLGVQAPDRRRSGKRHVASPQPGCRGSARATVFAEAEVLTVVQRPHLALQRDLVDRSLVGRDQYSAVGDNGMPGPRGNGKAALGSAGPNTIREGGLASTATTRSESSRPKPTGSSYSMGPGPCLPQVRTRRRSSSNSTTCRSYLS